MSEPLTVAGIMSGTSLDGVDVALARVEGHDEASFAWEMLGFRTVAYDDDQRALIEGALGHGGARAVCSLNVELAEWFAEALGEACEEAGLDPGEVDLIGSHGQTVWHDPPHGEQRGATLQIGDPATLAERSGVAVVSDFRARDVAAGGHGAPLVPWVDRLLFSHPERARALQNIGGMANVTWLPRAGSHEQVLAFDTGPGVALLDAAAALATGGRQRQDDDGRLAARGEVDETRLAKLLSHEFFAQPPPKSTGREVFGEPLVGALARDLDPGRTDEGWPDLLATLTALSARSIGDAYDAWVTPRGVDEVFLLGGGAKNPALVSMLTQRLSPLVVRPAEELGVDPDAREALAFAVLAWAHARGLPANLPSATGASGPRVLGSFTPGKRA